MATTDENFMLAALEQARQAGVRDEVPIGAVLVVNEQIVAAGSNRREETHRTSAHAEIEALDIYNRSAKSWRLPAGAALYVTVEPCLMCTGALLWARLTHLYYGCSDTKDAGLQRVRPLIDGGTYDHCFQSVTGGILESDCAGLISGYFKAKRHR